MIRDDDAVRGAAGLAGVLVLACACALPLRAQVTQQPIVQPKQPPPRPIQAPPRGPVGDLVIVAVTVSDNQSMATGSVASVTAQVRIRNSGSSSVVYPIGKAFARGDAAKAGGIAFQQVSTNRTDTIKPGEERTASLLGDPCAPAGAVTFRIDPDNAVPEASEANNGFVVPLVKPYATGDMVAGGVWLEAQSPASKLTNPPTQVAPPNVVPIQYSADLVVSFKNPGPGLLVVCPNAPAGFRETQSPVSGKRGLRTWRFPLPDNLVPPPERPVRYRPGNTVIMMRIVDAFLPGELQPGTYTWSTVLNPDGSINEASNANNTSTTTFKVTLPGQ